VTISPDEGVSTTLKEKSPEKNVGRWSLYGFSSETQKTFGTTPISIQKGGGASTTLDLGDPRQGPMTLSFEAAEELADVVQGKLTIVVRTRTETQNAFSIGTVKVRFDIADREEDSLLKKSLKAFQQLVRPEIPLEGRSLILDPTLLAQSVVQSLSDPLFFLEVQRGFAKWVEALATDRGATLTRP
jgi:hypothetical protein